MGCGSKKKGQALTVFWIVVGAIVFVVGMGFLLGPLLGISFFSQVGETGSGKYDYSGQPVDATLNFANIYNATALNPTCYIYNEEPSAWENGRIDVESGYIDTVTGTSGSAVFTDLPGDYFVRCQLSTYYDTFSNLNVPDSGDVPLSDYNTNDGSLTKLKLYPVATLTTSNLDLGVTVNTTTDGTFTSTDNFGIGEDTAYCLSEVKIQVDATYDFTETLDNGDSEEGVDKFEFTIEGIEKTPWDKDSSIDLFGSDNEYIIDMGDRIIGENEFVDVKAYVEYSGTNTTLGDADGYLGNAEDIIDSVVFIDCKGTTATMDITG